jgi:hypothetical protein
MTNPTCTITDCSKPARSAKAELCPMHYHRQYRHGSTDMVAHVNGVSVSLGRRYRQVPAKGHPLAHADGRAYEHRVVLYDTIGPGPHPCHWCGTEVDWLPKGTEGELQPDHLNGDGSDNRTVNLVPSCRRCNTTRGSQRRADALRAAGWWSNNDTIAQLSSHQRAARVEVA